VDPVIRNLSINVPVPPPLTRQQPGICSYTGSELLIIVNADGLSLCIMIASMAKPCDRAEIQSVWTPAVMLNTTAPKLGLLFKCWNEVIQFQAPTMLEDALCQVPLSMVTNTSLHSELSRHSQPGALAVRPAQDAGAPLRMCNEYIPGFAISIWYASNPRNCAYSSQREPGVSGCPFHTHNITGTMCVGSAVGVRARCSFQD
jgi:hypothetical protein